MGLGAGFGKGLMQGSSFVQSAYGAYKDSEDRQDKAEQKKAFAEIAKETPEASTGFTAEQGGELEKLASQGYKIDFDQSANAYTAKNGAGDTKQVAMQGVTDYFGNRTAGTMSQAQVDNTKLMKMADVIGKSDPMAALRMKKEVREGEYQAKRQGREEKAWAKEDNMEALDAKLGQDFETSLVGEDGKKRAPTADDYMKANQQRAFAYAQGGHMKEAQSAFKENLATAHVKIQMDAAERKQALGQAMAALSSGDYGAVADFYNKYVPSGSKVTGIEAGKDGSMVLNRVGMDGKPMAPMAFKDQREAMAALNSLENPSALYQYSQDEFSNQLKLRSDERDGKRLDESIRHNRFSEGMQAQANSRANASAGRAAASEGRDRSEREVVRGVREALFREQNPNATEAQLKAVRHGVIDIPGAGKEKENYSYSPGDIQKTFGETSTDPISGKETIKRNAAKEQKFQDFWAENPQIKNQDRALQEFQRSESKARRAAEPPKVSSKSEFEKIPAGQKYIDPNGDVRVKPGAVTEAAPQPPSATPKPAPVSKPASAPPAFVPAAHSGADGTPKPKQGPSANAKEQAGRQIAAMEKQLTDVGNSSLPDSVKFMRSQDISNTIKKMRGEYGI